MRTPAGVVLGGILTLLAPAPVWASVIYTFTPSTVTRTPELFPGAPVNGAGFVLEVRDSAIRKGSFSLFGSDAGTPNGGPAGDTANLVRFVIDGFDFITPSYLFGTVNLSLSFSPTGDVVSGSVGYFGVNTELDLSISNNSVSGYFGADEPSCNAPAINRVCFESGTLVRTLGPADVPEPASIALLGTAALGLGAVTRRRRVTAAG